MQVQKRLLKHKWIGHGIEGNITICEDNTDEGKEGGRPYKG
jgi:hypothetical protein